mgnify:CR=1 FL=1
MQTINKKTSISPIQWLKNEYPKGIDLVYIDYRDNFEDMGKLQDILKTGEFDDLWLVDSQYESINYVIGEYKKQNNIEELSDEETEEVKDWLFEHDTSNPLNDLLKNTRRKLCYIETEDIAEQYSDKEDYQKQLKELKKKYAKTNEQKKEIDYVLREQFYGAPVSFYFYLSVLDIYNTIHDSKDKYIFISGAYFSTIDRVQGSNWLGDKGVFNIAIPKQTFVNNFYLDSSKGNGYGWGEIAGQVESSYEEAEIGSGNKIKDSILINAETSETQKREQRLQAQWDKTHKCRAGDFDMNWNRHSGKKAYSNDYPCGNKCSNCGTFWID